MVNLYLFIYINVFFFSLFEESLPIANAVSALGQKLSHVVCSASDTCQRQGATERPQCDREGPQGLGDLQPWLLPGELGARTYLFLDSIFPIFCLFLKECFELAG